MAYGKQEIKNLITQFTGLLSNLTTVDKSNLVAAVNEKVDKVTGKQLSTEDYTTTEKTKLAGIASGAQVNDANTTLQGNTFNGVSQLVKTDASGKLPALDGSNLTNLPSGGSGIWAGTGSAFTSYAKGDLIFASDANILSKLPAGVEGKVLNVTGGIPTWGNVPVAAGALLADGTIPLTGNWNAGAQSIQTTQTAATGNTTYDGFLLRNTTPATATNSQSYSPAIIFEGQSWNVSNSTSNKILFRSYVQGTSGVSGSYVIESSLNNGTTWGTVLNLTSGGSGAIFGLNMGGGVVTSGTWNATSGSIATGRLTALNVLGVGIASASAYPSVMLQVESTTKGFLPPRMTATQRDAIATPAEGLVIYNLTTHKLNLYTGSSWEQVTSA